MGHSITLCIGFAKGGMLSKHLKQNNILSTTILTENNEKYLWSIYEKHPRQCFRNSYLQLFFPLLLWESQAEKQRFASRFFMVLVTYNGDMALKMGNCQKRRIVSLMNNKKKMCISRAEWILTHISYEKDNPNKTEWARHPLNPLMVRLCGYNFKSLLLVDVGQTGKGEGK